MAKLYFRFGTVGSAKTLNLLAVAHNYQTQNKKTLLLKPALDERFGMEDIRSRAGLVKKADYLINDKTDFIFQGKRLLGRQKCYDNEAVNLDAHRGVACILVDEAQFLSAEIIDQLHLITLKAKIPVICYGLKTNFRGYLFEGTRRIIELADSIEEVKSTCHYCDRKALFNLKLKGNVPIWDGPEIELGAEETYKPVCKTCYYQLLQKKTMLYN